MKHIFLLLLLAGTIYKSSAQVVTKGMEILELAKISDYYTNADNLSMDMLFTYSDSANAAAIVEQINGKYKIQYGRFWSMLDSIETITGNQYNVSVYHKDSIITIYQNKEKPDIMSVPFMDSLYYEAFIDSININTLNSTRNIVRVFFKPNAQYRSYELVYHKDSLYIDRFAYYITDLDSLSDVTSGVIKVGVQFYNYSTAVIDGNYFNESKFIYRSNNQFYTRPLYTGYRIILANRTEENEEVIPEQEF
jgi:hypothetical protein